MGGSEGGGGDVWGAVRGGGGVWGAVRERGKSTYSTEYASF